MLDLAKTRSPAEKVCDLIDLDCDALLEARVTRGLVIVFVSDGLLQDPLRSSLLLPQVALLMTEVKKFDVATADLSSLLLQG